MVEPVTTKVEVDASAAQEAFCPVEDAREFPPLTARAGA